MKKLQKKANNVSYKSVAAIAILMAVVLVFVFTQYAKTVISLNNEVTYAYLKEISSAAAKEVKAKFEGNMQTLDAIAILLEENRLAEVDGVMGVLNQEKLKNKFDHLVYILPDGQGYGAGALGKNFSHRDYFIRALAGEGNISVLDEGKISKERMIIYATPRYQGDIVVGVLVAIQNQDIYQSMISESAMGDQGFSRLIDGTGAVIIGSWHKNSVQKSENILDEAHFTEAAARDVFLADLQSGQSGILKYSAEGVVQVTCYTPIKINDWYMMTVVPGQVMSKACRQMLLLTGLFSLLAITSLVSLFIYTSLKQAKNRKQIEQLAYRDQLTGGLNLNKFKLLAAALLLKKRDEKLAIIRIDVDNFKLINEMYGFEAGDDVLKNIDQALGCVNCKHKIFGRIANDDFVLILTYETDQDIEARGQEFQRHFRRLHTLQGKNYKIDFTSGIYKILPEETDIVMMLERATMAHKTAKNTNGIQVLYYEDSIRGKAVMNKIIENTMHEALVNGEFVVFLQPKYDLKTEKIAGAEALIRWITPEQVVRSPDEFIPLFEKNGFIVKIDLFVLEQVCKIQKHWLDKGITPVTISVNQSKLLVSSQDYIEKVHGIVTKQGIAPGLIELELTETILHDDIDVLNHLMQSLQELGYVISIDDFGSGYSSLNLLKEIHADVLKIDREFLNRSENNARGKIVLSNIIRLAKELDMSIVTEGVETRKQADMLRDLGCDTAQGFLFAKPMLIEEFEKRL